MAKKKLSPKEEKEKNDQVNQMCDYVEVETHADCQGDGCKSVIGEWMTDEYGLADKMFNEGWRVVTLKDEDGDDYEALFCTSCVRKHNAKKSKKKKK